MKTRTYFLHALSPLHVGVGQSAEIIDLPIARLKGTNIPYVPGSAIKGVLREALSTADAEDATGGGERDGTRAGGDRDQGQANDGHREEQERRNSECEKVLAIFGPGVDAANDHAGALVCADARLFALPVRSYKGIFAYATSPLLLALARRDLGKDSLSTPIVAAGTALVTRDSALVLEEKVYLEDLDLGIPDGGNAAAAGNREENDADRWADSIARIFGDKDAEKAPFTKRFVIVDDETMAFLWETATQTDTRVRIHPETRSVAKGMLWIEESLPPETLLIGILAAERSRRLSTPLSPDDVLKETLPSERTLQFGGKATVGRGRCRIVPF